MGQDQTQVGGEIFDILIVGSGIGARCAALAIGQSDSSVSIAALALSAASDDMPAVLVSPPCQHFLRNIGCWPALSSGAQSIDTLHVSEQGRLGASRFTGADLGEQSLGSVIEVKLLAANVPEIANTIACAAVLGISSGDDVAVVQVRDSSGAEQSLQARLVLVADEGVAAAASLQSFSEAPAKSAISFVATMAADHCDVAYQRYVADSKITALPSAGARDVRFVVEGPAAIALADSDNELSKNQVQSHFGHRLGRIQSFSKETTVLLSESVPVVRQPRVIELGSPATVAPFAAGNLHGCCYAIAALVALLSSENLSSATIGRQLAAQLENYQPITAGLDRLFAAELGPLNHLRGVGLMALELATPLRQQLIRRQLGQASPLPVLMQQGKQSGSEPLAMISAGVHREPGQGSLL